MECEAFAEACPAAQLGESVTSERGRSLPAVDGPIRVIALENWLVEVVVFIV